MSALEKIAMTQSPEAELARQIEEIIRKLACADVDDPDRENNLAILQDLQRRRVEMMRPKILKRHVPA